MKKILLFLVALVATLSMNAQTTEIHNKTGKVASYLGADVNVKFGMDGSDPTIMVYKGDKCQETYKGSEYKVVSTPVEETLKAVYNTNGGANTLTFYYDAVDHSGKGITVYQDGTANYLFDDSQSEGEKWGYNDVRYNVSNVVIDESVKKYSSLTSTAYMFKDMTNATGISGAEYLDVANVTDMSNMFELYGYKSTSLTVVPDVSGWNTGNVKNMANMFNQYGNNSTSLTVVPDVSGWNTGNVKNMANMFFRYGYTSASFNAVPNVSEWKTDSLTDMNKMFNQYGYNSTSLTVVPDVSGWKTGNVTNMDDLFNCYGYKSTSLTIVPDVSKWNTGNVKNMTNMFYGYGYNSTSLTVVPDVSGWNTDKVTNMTGLFRSYGYKSTSLTVVPDVSGWKTGNVTNMDRLFDSYGYYSTSLTVVPNVSKWNTGNVENMGNMFYRYGYKSGSLNAVPNVSKWNTGNVTDMSGIFDSYGYNSTSLAAFPAVSGWNTGNVKKMGNMFYQYGYESGNIEFVLDLSGWNLANVTSGTKVFDFKPKTFSVTIPAKTGDKANDASHWYYGNGSKSIAPPSDKFSFSIFGQGSAAVNAGAGVTDNKVKWVQLWEDGPKFAVCNVGVTDGKAESYGDYFTWANNIAESKWGSSWRMPTKEDFQALLDSCTREPIENYNGTGVNGVKFTGKGDFSGNSIFLPAAGIDINGVAMQGIYEYYWSSTPDDSNDEKAYAIGYHNYSMGFSVNVSDRTNGFSVRAVVRDPVAVTGVSLNKTTLELGVGASETLTPTFIPADADNKNVSWTSDNESVATVDANGKVTAVAIGEATITVTTEDGGKTATCAVEVVTTGTAKRTGDIDVNWVQLWKGGPKFAEYNVGVTDGKAESYGGYYCWGNTVDQDSKGAYKGGTSALTGTGDTATNLWGSNWRMPTKDEFDALLANCTCTWIEDYNGTSFKGLLCKGKENTDYASNSVFLPAAGYFFSGSVSSQGDNGYYWSSTPDGSGIAYCLKFNSGNQNMPSAARMYGYSVRAVLAK